MFMFYFLLTTNQCNCNVNDLKGLSFYNSFYDDVVAGKETMKISYDADVVAGKKTMKNSSDANIIDAKEMMKILSDADVVAAKETMKSFAIRCEGMFTNPGQLILI